MCYYGSEDAYHEKCKVCGLMKERGVPRYWISTTNPFNTSIHIGVDDVGLGQDGCESTWYNEEPDCETIIVKDVMES